MLSNALALQESPNAPDGTNELVKKTLGLARTDADATSAGTALLDVTSS